MERRLTPIQPLIGIVGRILLGLYFLIPGLSKIPSFEETAQYMEIHGVPGVIPLLALTIVLQVSGGSALIVGWQTRVTALMLAGMTLIINIFIHDFWNVYEGLNQQHETQNFIKNLAIMAGLLVLAAGPACNRWSIDERTKNSA